MLSIYALFTTKYISVGLYFIYVGCSLLCVVPNLIEPFATRKKHQDIQINFRSQSSIQPVQSEQQPQQSISHQSEHFRFTRP